MVLCMMTDARAPTTTTPTPFMDMTSRATTTTSRSAAALVTRRDPRWPRVVARDAAADGSFVYAVKTTGVYCRPSCAARPARPENVTFYATVTDAEAAGFRPCKRCKPRMPPASERRASQVAELCRFIEARMDGGEDAPSLEDIAAKANLSVSHVHRMFKEVTGLTPKDYAAAHRAKKTRVLLRQSTKTSVTSAIYDAGFASSGRFYEKSTAMLGMTPSKYKTGGAEVEIRFAIGECSLGSILVAATSKGVCAVLLGDDPEELAHDLERRFPRARLIGADATFEALVAKVVGLVESPLASTATSRDLPLDIRGTAFQERVWKALRKIPAGKTVTYTELARSIGAPKAVRAVAQACAANAIAIAIPCHRVIRNDGNVSGYRWGVDRKRALLARESR